MTSNTGIDTWNLISGAIGVVTVLPFIWAIVWNQHPETKLTHLESTLKDTESLLRSVVEEGLLHHEHHVPHFESNLIVLRNKTEALREETFIASIEWRKLIQAWLNGLSRRIDTLCKQVKAVRANICETSADARIRRREQHLDEMFPVHRRWCAKIARIWVRIVSFVCRSPTVESPNALAYATPGAPLASDDIVSMAGDAATAALEGTTCLHDNCFSPPPSRDSEASTQHPNPKSSRASSGVPRTASRALELHALARAIRRVDRELTAQGVTNTRLTQLVQATHERWSPASTKAYLPRRSHKKHVVLPHPKHVLALQSPSDPSTSSVDSFGEETVCEF